MISEVAAETRLKAARLEHQWKKARVIAGLREAAARRQLVLPSDDSLRRMLAFWENGHRRVSDPMYVELFAEIYGVPPTELGLGEVLEEAAAMVEPALEERLSFSDIDRELVRLVEAQTQNYRLLDRRHGGAALLQQTCGHVAYLDGLLTHALPGSERDGVAVALAEAAALAGWQALDAGDEARAWRMHERAKAAARDAGDPVTLAHVTAQQAYVLLDVGKAAQAATVVQHAHRRDLGRLPSRLRAWLYAAEGEMHAARGDEAACMRALDQAAAALPRDLEDEGLPFLMLDEANLVRWRGHCRARLGTQDAVDNLTRALDALGGRGSLRAATGLRVDLATALAARGDHSDALDQAQQALHLCHRTGSARQRSRALRLLASLEGGEMQQPNKRA
jgi:tetratricopeptide (TPR) repeat protein